MDILLVDDSAAMRAMVLRALRQAGYEHGNITQASDGAIALAAIREQVPDLVLSDWNMPNMTGLELLEALKADGIETIFGFITSEATPEMRAKAAACGAEFLIAKPFTVRSVMQALDPFMTRPADATTA